MKMDISEAVREGLESASLSEGMTMIVTKESNGVGHSAQALFLAVGRNIFNMRMLFLWFLTQHLPWTLTLKGSSYVADGFDAYGYSVVVDLTWALSL